MNRWIIFFLGCLTIFVGRNAWAEDAVSLQTKLENLSVPANQGPLGVTGEKLYAVQTRYTPLKSNFEVFLGGAKNFSGGGVLSSTQVDLGTRFYISNRWFIGANGSAVFNKLTGYSKNHAMTVGTLPDFSYAKFRGDLLGGFNLFYGKFRVNMDTVFYFDQYVALGPGVVALNTGTKGAAVADVGFVLWLGRKTSLHIGLKDYFFKETRALSSGYVHNFLGHLQFGYLFL